MKRGEFANTSKRLYKGRWIQERPDAELCPVCRPAGRQFSTLDIARPFCANCGGRGFIAKPAFRYQIPSKKKFEKNQDIVFVEWSDAAAPPRFKNCLKCKGRRCISCNFKGQIRA